MIKKQRENALQSDRTAIYTWPTSCGTVKCTVTGMCSFIHPELIKELILPNFPMHWKGTRNIRSQMIKATTGTGMAAGFRVGHHKDRRIAPNKSFPGVEWSTHHPSSVHVPMAQRNGASGANGATNVFNNFASTLDGVVTGIPGCTAIKHN